MFAFPATPTPAPEPLTLEQRDRITELRLSNSDIHRANMIAELQPDIEVADPYKNCEKQCNHDTVSAVLITDIHGPDDGPNTPSPLQIVRRDGL